MEKLIELLNEYEELKEKETEIRNYTRKYMKYDGEERIEWTREVDGTWFGEEESTAIIICKGYMFIQWLVENEKIDVERVYNNSDYPMVKRNEFLYEWLLMLLSIQDNPIEFLVSILK